MSDKDNREDEKNINEANFINNAKMQNLVEKVGNIIVEHVKDQSSRTELISQLASISSFICCLSLFHILQILDEKAVEEFMSIVSNSVMNTLKALPKDKDSVKEH